MNARNVYISPNGTDLKHIQWRNSVTTFVTTSSIREMVASATVRAEAVKVKLIALLTWVRLEAKRILKSLNRIKFAATTNPRIPKRRRYHWTEYTDYPADAYFARTVTALSDTEMWCEVYSSALSLPTGQIATPQPINAATYIAPVLRDGLLVPAGYTPVPMPTAQCGSHFCPRCSKVHFGNIVDNVWSCPCCPFRLNLGTGEVVAPFEVKHEKAEYIRITAEYVAQVLARSNTDASVRTALSWQM